MNRTSVPNTFDLGRDVNHVLERLAGEMASMSPQLRKAAAFVLDHPGDVGLATVRELAGAARVKPNTLVRMARAVGFDGFEGFREPFRNDLRIGSNPCPGRAHRPRQRSTGGPLGTLYADIVTAALANLEQTFAGVGAEELKVVADRIVAARRTYVIGGGSTYALAQNFADLVGMTVEHVVAVPRPGDVPMDTVLRAGAADVVVALAFEPYRADVVAATEAARRQGATLVAITDSHGSPIAVEAGHVIVAAGSTPQSFPSTLAATAMLETLAAFIVADSGPDAVAAIEQSDQRRYDLGVYWKGGE